MKKNVYLTQDLKIISLLLILGFLIRSIALLFTSSVEGDAAERVYLAWQWLDNPEFITHGIWPPLHTYLIAASMWLVKDPILSPIWVNICFACATAVPLYFFTKNEFGEKASWFVAGAFLFYPISFRNSLMALSDTPFTFFVALSLLFISQARKIDGSEKDAIIAGLALTLSSMLRYEGWVLIVLFGFLISHKPKLLLFFLISAAIFPIFWMLGNYLHYGDPLYSIHYQEQFEINLRQSSGGMTSKQIIIRWLFFPISLIFGMTLAIFSLSINGIYQAIFEQKRVIWLIPFIGLLALFTYKSVTGSLALATRYSLTLGMFLLPFAALTLEKITNPRKKVIIGGLAIFSMLPFSYIPALISPLTSSLFGVEISPKNSPKSSLAAIPRATKSDRALIELIEQQNIPRDRGLIMVNFDFERSQNVTLNNRMHYQHQFHLYRGFTGKQELNKLGTFLNNYPEGLIAFNDRDAETENPLMLQHNNLTISGYPQTLTLEKISNRHNYIIYRYSHQTNQITK